jgi:hypothetical protein
MHKVAVEPAVSILERMDVDEAECENGSGNNRIEIPRGATIKSRQAVDQSR